MDRRSFLAGVGAASSLLTFSCTRKPRTRETGFVFVHGSWSGAYLFGRVLPFLAQNNALAISIDLPGQGLNSAFPKSYFKRPLDEKAFATELSPVGHVTMDDCVNSIKEAAQTLLSAGCSSVVLVGHSSGGVPVTAAVEQMSEKVKAVVYIAGVIPVPGQPSYQVFQAPEAKGSRSGELLFPVDPEKIGALRIDCHIANAEFRKKAKEILFQEMSDTQAEIILGMQSTDAPFSLFKTPVQMTKSRWGAIPRIYIETTEDVVIPLPLQRMMQEKANQMNPQNITQRFSVASGHNPPFSRPKELAEVLNTLV